MPAGGAGLWVTACVPGAGEGWCLYLQPFWYTSGEYPYSLANLRLKSRGTLAPGQGIEQDREPCCILSPDKEHHDPGRRGPGAQQREEMAVPPTSLNPIQQTQDLLGVSEQVRCFIGC